MNKPDSFFYAIRLETTAMNAYLACRRVAADLELSVYERQALGKARIFVEAARSGERIKSSRRLSATPTFDLLALQYTREALPMLGTELQLGAHLDSLSAALQRAADGGALADPIGHWTPTSMAEYWKRIFWMAATLSSRPTDRRSSRPADGPAGVSAVAL